MSITNPTEKFATAMNMLRPKTEYSYFGVIETENDFNKITDLVNSPNINYKVEEIFGDGNASKKIVNKIAML